MNKTGIIALHGWVPPFVNGAKILQRDIQKLLKNRYIAEDPIDIYYPGFNVFDILNLTKRFDRTIIFGYSEGGMKAEQLLDIESNISDLVLYEAPAIKGYEPGMTTHKPNITLIWNSKGKTRRRYWVRESTKEMWTREGHKVESYELKNNLGHMSWFPVGHALDPRVINYLWELKAS